MQDYEAEAIADRAAKHVAQFPTMKAALGCLDCEFIFRSGRECPFCGSEAVWNVAAFLGGN